MINFLNSLKENEYDENEYDEYDERRNDDDVDEDEVTEELIRALRNDDEYDFRANDDRKNHIKSDPEGKLFVGSYWAIQLQLLLSGYFTYCSFDFFAKSIYVRLQYS